MSGCFLKRLLGVAIVAPSLLVAPLHAAALEAERTSISRSYRHLDAAQRRTVKLYGAGGFARVEAYQTGIVVEPSGVVLTVETPVLEAGEVMAILPSGERCGARVTGVDRRTGVATLRLAISPTAIGREEIDFFRLDARTTEGKPGERVFVVSNLFGVAAGAEPLSVQSGVVTGYTTNETLRLETISGAALGLGRRRLMLLDIITSNPGAAGGAVVDQQGRLLGMIGPERRSALTGGWANYALPVDQLELISDAFVAPDERVTSSAALAIETGLVLTPPVTEGTAPYVTNARSGTPAEIAGLTTDDLIVAVSGRTVTTREEALRAIGDALVEDGRVVIEVIRAGQIISMSLERTLQD